MKLRFEIILPILLLLIVTIPLTVYSDILNSNNLTQNNTTILNVPNAQEPTNYSSGPTALQSVLAYYGTDVKVDELINMTNTTLNGTTPSNIAQTAQQLGFNAEVKQNMTLNDLQQNINNGTPVIIDGQAWKANDTNSSNQNYTTDVQDGHYMVVIGIDNQNIYFEDPALLGSRGYIPNQEFLDRWHDQYIDSTTGNNTTNTTNLGIIISGREPATLPLFIKIG